MNRCSTVVTATDQTSKSTELRQKTKLYGKQIVDIQSNIEKKNTHKLKPIQIFFDGCPFWVFIFMFPQMDSVKGKKNGNELQRNWLDYQ